MEAQRLSLSFSDDSGGYETTPERVRLGDLARFAADVQDFLRGDSKEIDTHDLEVSIQPGSFQIVTTPIAAAPVLFADLRKLSHGDALDFIDPKRRRIIEKWQKGARQTGRRISYKIAAPFLPKPVKVTSQTNFRLEEKELWVMVERYVQGEIQDLGGSSKANAHVKLPDGNILTVATDKAILREERDNRLYKTAVLRIKAEYNLVTRELRNAKLIQFVEYSNQVDPDDIQRMMVRGAVAWQEVSDPAAWVNGQRGSEDVE